MVGNVFQKIFSDASNSPACKLYDTAISNTYSDIIISMTITYYLHQLNINIWISFSAIVLSGRVFSI